MSKICTHCNIELDLTKYYANKNICKSCSVLKSRAWNLANPERHRATKRTSSRKNKEKIAENNKNYYWENKEHLNAQNKQWRLDNPDKTKAAKEKFNVNNPDYEKNRRRTNPQRRISTNLRNRLNCALRGASKVGSAVTDLGCSREFLLEYIESLWQPGMSWENYGQRGNVWNLDHIKPLSSFNLENRTEFLEACHYSNIRPMWASENYSKRDKLDWKKPA